MLVADFGGNAGWYSPSGELPANSEIQQLFAGVAGTVTTVTQNGTDFIVTIEPNTPLDWPVAYQGKRSETVFKFYTSTAPVVGQPVTFDIFGATTPYIYIAPDNVNV